MAKYNEIEHSILSQLKHPNIVQFKRICYTKRHVYIIMELVPGGTLKQLMQKRFQQNKPFTDDEISLIMK